MNPTSTAIMAALCLLGSTCAATGQQAMPAPGAISLRECALEYERTTQVGAISQGASGGVMQKCLVKLGDRVKADQILGQVQNRDLVSQMMQAKAQADNQLEIQNSENMLAQVEITLKYNAEQWEKKYISRLAYNAFVLREKEAVIAVAQAKFNRMLAELKYQEIAAQVRDCEIRAPHDGVVVEVFKRDGERIMGGEAAFLVVDDSKLLVTGQLDIGDAWKVRQGQKALVTPEIEGVDLPLEREVFEGQVIFADNRLDPQTKTCRVVVRIANRDALLRSGLVARMEIQPHREISNAIPLNPPPPIPEVVDSRARASREDD